jgi:transcriptional regulator with XRE-family HTH domain
MPSKGDDRQVEAALERLREAVARYKWTQSEVADAAGLQRPTVNKWLTGKSVPTRNELYGALVFIAKEYGIELQELWGESLALELSVGKPMYPVGNAKIPIPLWPAVPAGDWEQPTDATDFFEVDASLAGAGRVACPIIGNSCSPTFEQGDMAVFKLTSHPPVGTFVLARNGDNEATLKLLRSSENGDHVLVSPKDGSILDAVEWHAIGYAIARYRNQAGAGSYDLMVRDPQGIRAGE